MVMGDGIEEPAEAGGEASAAANVASRASPQTLAGPRRRQKLHADFSRGPAREDEPSALEGSEDEAGPARPGRRITSLAQDQRLSVPEPADPTISVAPPIVDELSRASAEIQIASGSVIRGRMHVSLRSPAGP
ncbi:hypothetical protein LTR94_032030 [Friedmanniomyces endolithicus]|nr:hypothetical protein LTR94_032030 [Friedmanniomyces endolithicus]